MCQNFNLPWLSQENVSRNTTVCCQKISAFINKQGDINFESKHSAIYGHEENNPIYIFFSAKNPNKPTPSNLKKKKICLLKKIVTTTRVHYLSPTSSHDTFYYNHIKSHWLKVGLGVSHHLTCNPSWYWTAACIASPSLSTRSFHVLFNASQAEFSCK